MSDATYKYGGARALVALHEEQLLEFLDVWKKTKAANLSLPKTKDTDYESLETLLHHVLRAARGYMVWMCEQLDLPDPAIDEAPTLNKVEAQADAYARHLLERWRLPLVSVEASKFGPDTYVSNWNTPYCIDAMLEHAVMHPLRHSFQLRNLLQTL